MYMYVLILYNLYQNEPIINRTTIVIPGITWGYTQLLKHFFGRSNSILYPLYTDFLLLDKPQWESTCNKKNLF